MDWSHELLPQIERTVLRRLGVFRGDFTMEAAASLSPTSRFPGSRWSRASRTWRRNRWSTDTNGDVAYHRLLDTTRLYALEKLVESGDIARLEGGMRNTISTSSSRPRASASRGRKPSGWPSTAAISTMCAPGSIGHFLRMAIRRSAWR